MTLQDLKYHVLLKLGVVAAGDSPNPDDGATVEMRYLSLYSMLVEDGLTLWSVDDSVPPEAELPIVAMVAAECANDFANTDPQIQLAGKFGLPSPSPAERTLRKLTATPYIGAPAQPEYF